MFCLLVDLLPKAGVVVGGEGVAEDLDAAGFMEARDTLHEVGSWMVAEVGGDVANPKSVSAGVEVPRVLVGRLMQGGHLEEEEGGGGGR